MPVDWEAVADEVSEAIISIQDIKNPNAAKGVILRQGSRTGPGYDPEFGPDIEYPVNVVISNFRSNEIDGTLIRQDDVKVLVSPKGAPEEITTADRFRINGTDYEIVNVMPLQPASVAVLISIQCRR